MTLYRLASVVVVVLLAAGGARELLAQKDVASQGKFRVLTQRPIAIVVQDLAERTPIEAASVRIVDRSGKTLVGGITDGDGRFVARAADSEAFAIQFERIGYLRRPETMTLPATAITTPLVGRLLRHGGSASYYRQAGAAIEQAANGSGNPGWDIANEMDRASELPAESRVAMESGLSAQAKTELTAAREEIRTAAAKTRGNPLDAPYSVSPALRDFSTWVGVGVTGTDPGIAAIRKNLMNTRQQLTGTTFSPASLANHKAYERLLEEATTGKITDPAGGTRCVTQAGLCPMAKPVPGSSVCFCYTPYGLQYGLAQ